MAEFEVLNIKCKDFEMACLHFGKGKIPFVIMPGVSLKPVTLSAPAVVNMYKSFENDYDIYLFDRRNNMPENYSVFEMAEDTADVMQALGIKQAYIFGTSQGGMIAQYMAVYYPELVGKMVLGSTMARMNPTAKAVFDFWTVQAQKRDYAELNRSMLNYLFSDNFIERYGKMFLAMGNEGTEEDCHRFEILVRACVGVDIFDKLDKIQCPVLVIGAENDKVVSGDASREIAEKIGCELYMYENYGHAVYDEAPDYKQKLHDFFQKP